MVILFSGRKSTAEKDIIDILSGYGASYISDKAVISGNGDFTIVSEYKKSEIRIKKGIAVFIDDTDRFDDQIFPDNMIGICEERNITALKAFKKSGIPVISCGMNSKNTVTLSSMNSNTLLATLQRSLTDRSGNNIYPTEFKIRLKKSRTPFAIMASVAVLLLNGITPNIL